MGLIFGESLQPTSETRHATTQAGRSHAGCHVGALTVVPSWRVYSVGPVTRGQRWSLAVFGTGPPLR